MAKTTKTHKTKQSEVKKKTKKTVKKTIQQISVKKKSGTPIRGKKKIVNQKHKTKVEKTRKTPITKKREIKEKAATVTSTKDTTVVEPTEPQGYKKIRVEIDKILGKQYLPPLVIDKILAKVYKDKNYKAKLKKIVEKAVEDYLAPIAQTRKSQQNCHNS